MRFAAILAAKNRALAEDPAASKQAGVTRTHSTTPTKFAGVCRSIPPHPHNNAGVAEMADAPDLGSGEYSCRFKSCRPYQKRGSNCYPFFWYGRQVRGNAPNFCAHCAQNVLGAHRWCAFCRVQVRRLEELALREAQSRGKTRSTL